MNCLLHVCVHVWVHAHTHTHMCMHMCKHIHTHTHTRTVVTVEPPRSQVALPGTIVNYSCHGIGYVELKFNGTIIAHASTAADMHLNDLGINFEHFDDNSFDISINASVYNNGTFFVCEDEDDIPSPKMYVYTVNGKSQSIIYIKS